MSRTKCTPIMLETVVHTKLSNELTRGISCHERVAYGLNAFSGCAVSITTITGHFHVDALIKIGCFVPLSFLKEDSEH